MFVVEGFYKRTLVVVQTHYSFVENACRNPVETLTECKGCTMYRRSSDKHTGTLGQLCHTVSPDKVNYLICF